MFNNNYDASVALFQPGRSEMELLEHITISERDIQIVDSKKYVGFHTKNYISSCY